MRRISTATRVIDKFGAGKDGYTNGSVVGGVPATDLQAEVFDHVQEEIANVIEKTGTALDASKYTQLFDSIRKQSGVRNLVSFTAPGATNWTVPTDIYRIHARVWGAGGGGGGTSNGGAAGGAGGGYSEGWFNVTPGQVLTVTVGQGGSGGGGTPTAGGFGSTTSIAGLLSGTGGGGGNGASGGSGAAVNTNIGTGSGGQLNVSGGVSNGGVTVGSTPLGSAGGPAFSTSLIAGFSTSTGNGAGYPGGGGGGAGGSTFAAGAVGANGLATIAW